MANYFVYRRCERWIAGTKEPFKKNLINSAPRLFAPISAAILLLLTSLVFAAPDKPFAFLDKVALLALALAGIRLLVYILRKAFPVTPLLKTWENLFVLLTWSMFALYYLEWLAPTITAPCPARPAA